MMNCAGLLVAITPSPSQMQHKIVARSGVKWYPVFQLETGPIFCA
jgi:hypothetical protein